MITPCKIGKAKVLFYYFTFFTKIILVKFIKSHFGTSALRIKLIKFNLSVLLKALKYRDLIIHAHTCMHAYIHVHTYSQSQPQTQVLTRKKPAIKTEVRLRGPKQFSGVANKRPLRGSSPCGLRDTSTAFALYLLFPNSFHG